MMSFITVVLEVCIAEKLVFMSTMVRDMYLIKTFNKK